MVFDICLLVIALGAGFYVVLKRPEWAVRHYREMSKQEKMKTKITENKIFISTAVLCFSVAAIETFLIIRQLLG